MIFQYLIYNSIVNLILMMSLLLDRDVKLTYWTLKETIKEINKRDAKFYLLLDDPASAT